VVDFCECLGFSRCIKPSQNKGKRVTTFLLIFVNSTIVEHKVVNCLLFLDKEDRGSMVRNLNGL